MFVCGLFLFSTLLGKQGSREMVCRSVESQQGWDGFNFLHNTGIDLYFFFLAEQQCFIIIIPTLRNPIRDCNCFFYGRGSALVCLYGGSPASIFFFPNLWLFTKWHFWLPNFNLIFLCGSRYYKKSERKSPEVEVSFSSSKLRSLYGVLLWYFSLFSMFHHDQQMGNGH